MKKAIKKKWLEALRSGEYKQGRAVLRTADDKFCCLGVLCELAAREGAIDQPVQYDKGASFSYGKDGFARSKTSLPTPVIEWAFTKHELRGRASTEQRQDPVIGNRNASYLNDVDRFNFDQIADLIEEHL